MKKAESKFIKVITPRHTIFKKNPKYKEDPNYFMNALKKARKNGLTIQMLF